MGCRHRPYSHVCLVYDDRARWSNQDGDGKQAHGIEHVQDRWSRENPSVTPGGLGETGKEALGTASNARTLGQTRDAFDYTNQDF